MQNDYKINFMRDDEAGVWIATSDDVPGLVLEHDSLDILMARVRLAAPELLELNCGFLGEANFSFAMLHRERLVVSG
jgi:hypothetical protein